MQFQYVSVTSSLAEVRLTHVHTVQAVVTQLRQDADYTAHLALCNAIYTKHPRQRLADGLRGKADFSFEERAMVRPVSWDVNIQLLHLHRGAHAVHHAKCRVVLRFNVCIQVP